MAHFDNLGRLCLVCAGSLQVMKWSSALLGYENPIATYHVSGRSE